MKPSANPGEEAKGAIALIEEAVWLLRNAPASALMSYYVGSAPFVVALLYFWSDMARSPLAPSRLAPFAMILAALFIWMKCWQCAFTEEVWRILECEPRAPATVTGRVRSFLFQAALQPTGLLLLPLAACLALPFGWLYAFYQNATVIGHRDFGSLKEAIVDAWRQSMIWPMQNHLIIWLVCPWLLILGAGLWLIGYPLIQSYATPENSGLLVVLGILNAILVIVGSPVACLLAANFAMALAMIPWLLRTFFGVEVGVSGGLLAMLNSTFFAIVCGLTYLTLDPVVKTAYTLRCFYGSARRTGEDIQVALKRAVARSGLVLLLAFAAGSPVFGAEPSADRSTPPRSEELDQSISQVLRRSEFAWRLPRESMAEEAGEASWFQTMLNSLRETLEEWSRAVLRALENWIRRLLESALGSGEAGSAARWTNTLRWSVFVLVGILAILCAIWLTRLWRRRKQAVELLGIQLALQPDLESAETSASDLPEDGWLALANEMVQKGELRLAIRALYLANLAHLADRRLVTVAKHKSNRDFQRELNRTAHALPDISSLFSEIAQVFDRVWYGRELASAELFHRFEGTTEKLRAA